MDHVPSGFKLTRSSSLFIFLVRFFWVDCTSLTVLVSALYVLENEFMQVRFGLVFRRSVLDCVPDRGRCMSQGNMMKLGANTQHLFERMDLLLLGVPYDEGFKT